MLRSNRPPAMSQNYKDTLNLPRTVFPMKANLAAREPEMLRTWEETRLYREIQKSRGDRELFVLHDGPPFANGDVHMDTALNKILKDFVVKSQTMLGKRAPYTRSNIRNATTPPFTCDFRSLLANGKTKRALPSGPQLPGRCRPISPSLWMQRRAMWSKNFREMGLLKC